MHKNMQNKAKYAVKYAQSLHFNAYLFNQRALFHLVKQGSDTEVWPAPVRAFLAQWALIKTFLTSPLMWSMLGNSYLTFSVTSSVLIAKAKFFNFLPKLVKYALNMKIKVKYALHANKTLICTKGFICINVHP